MAPSCEPGFSNTSFVPSSRFGIVLQLHLAGLVAYFGRINLSVALDGAQGIAAAYSWNDTDKGLVLSAFFHGYWFMQPLWGWLAKRRGARRVLLFSFTMQGVLSLVFVLCAKAGSIVAAFVARLLLGIVQAAYAPCMMYLLETWLPARESSRGYSIADSGTMLGAAVAMGISPLLLDFGWPFVFYFSAATSFAWAFSARYWIWDGPTHHPRIAPAELQFLSSPDGVNVHDMSRQGDSVPWRALFTHSAVWNLLIVYFATNCFWYVFLTFLPQYFHNQLHFNMRDGGLLETLPYIACLIGSYSFALVADYMIAWSSLSITIIRKLMHTIGSVCPAALLVCMVYSSSPNLAVMLFVASNFLYGAAYSGAFVAPIEVSEGYAGPIMGVTNGFGNVAGIVAPVITGLLLDHGGCSTDMGSSTCKTAWKVVFFTASGSFAISLAVFLAFGRADAVVKRAPENAMVLACVSDES